MMEIKKLNEFIEHCKQRNELEKERRRNNYTILGISLAVVGYMYSLAAKIFDSFPKLKICEESLGISGFYIIFIIVFVIGIFSLLVTTYYVVTALWPTNISYPPLPKEQVEYFEKLKEYHTSNDVERATENVEKEYLETMLNNCIKEIDVNFEHNNLRSDKINGTHIPMIMTIACLLLAFFLKFILELIK